MIVCNWERFIKHIGYKILSVNAKHLNFLGATVSTNEMIVNFNVFDACKKNNIVGNRRDLNNIVEMD